MSADNFNFVRKRKDGTGWDVWLNLSASNDTHPQLERKPPDATHPTEHDARLWADAQGYTEYGTLTDDEPDAPVDIDELERLAKEAGAMETYDPELDRTFSTAASPDVVLKLIRIARAADVLQRVVRDGEVKNEDLRIGPMMARRDVVEALSALTGAKP